MLVESNTSMFYGLKTYKNIPVTVHFFFFSIFINISPLYGSFILLKVGEKYII